MNRPDDAAKQFADLIKRFPDTRWAKLAAEKREASPPRRRSPGVAHLRARRIPPQVSASHPQRTPMITQTLFLAQQTPPPSGSLVSTVWDMILRGGWFMVPTSPSAPSWP